MIAHYSMSYAGHETDLIGPRPAMLDVLVDRVQHMLPGETITITRQD